MSGEMITLLASVLLSLAIGPVIRWFGRSFQALALMITGSPTAAIYAYHALLLPGTLLHEVSHLVTARLLGAPTGRLSLRLKMHGAGMAQFGSVEVGATDPLRSSLIGLAPLVTGIGAVFLIARLRLGLWLGNGGPATLADAWSALAAARDSALWLYLIVVIGNAMLPSASDRRAWLRLALLVAGGLAALYVVGLLARVAPEMIAVALNALETLSLVFALLLVVDAILGALFWALTLALGRLLRRRLVAV